MRTSLRIGGGAGFAGDRLDAPLQLAERGALDYLVLECLAERTIALAQLRRRRDPAGGYDTRLAARIETLLPILKSRGIKLISNCGAANPLAAADAIVAIARRLRIPVKVAAVTGDDVLAALDLHEPTMEGGNPIIDVRSDHFRQRLSWRRGPAACAGQRRGHYGHGTRGRSFAVRGAVDARVRLGAGRRRPPRPRHRGGPPPGVRGAAVRGLLRRSRSQGNPRHGASRFSIRGRRRRRQRHSRQSCRHRRAYHARNGDRATAV